MSHMQERSNRSPAQPRRRQLLLAGLAVLGAGVGTSLLAACGQGAAQTPASVPRATQAPTAAKARKVSVRFNWTIKGEFTLFFVAREKGFYTEQGLDPDLLEGKSGTQAAQVVGTGNDHFGYIPSIQVIQAVNQGIPLKAVATCGTNTGMCWASPPDIPLTGPKSLEGHKVSISASSTFFQVWDAFARKFGVDKSRVDAVNSDPSARVGLFLQKQLDIMADIFLANDYVILQDKTRDKLNLFKLADVDFDPVGYLLTVNGPVLDSDKALVHSFTQATLKGLQYTLDHPDEATQIMVKLYSDQLGAAVIEGQVKNLLPLINRAPALGNSDQAAWDKSLAMLLDAGVIDKKLAHDQYYTNEFVA